MPQPEHLYEQSERPAVALITNHGYGGVDLPVGGAPDTGGQNLYVNSLARALDTLKFRVTIFARGGFPFFESDRIRREPEYLTDYVRYVFVPGGGDEFLRKEDIAVALDEQIDWLDAFIRKEAAEKACDPWDVYEFVNTHYWDGAIMGTRLVERWQNDAASSAIGQLLRGAVPDEVLTRLHKERHWEAVGDAPDFHLGRLLIENTGPPTASLVDRVRQAAGKLADASGIPRETVVGPLTQAVQSAVGEADNTTAPILEKVRAADAIGAEVLRLFPEQAERLRHQLSAIDRHVWTPHSLGSLKDQNFRDQPIEVRRNLKFGERRSHERVVCARTRMFAATSDEITTQFRTQFGISADRIFYFPPCVDPTVFHPREEHELESTYEYVAKVSGLSVNTLRDGHILFETSRMDSTKRKDLLLDAFARVAQQREDVYLLIGGGPENDVYQALAEQRDANSHLKGRAFLTGYIPEEHIGPLFALADIYVSASEMEGFGMSALQAAASGTALVASDLTPFAVQYVPDDAMVVPAGSVEDFAAAIVQLLDDETDRQGRIRGLLKRVRALHWEAQTRTFVERLKEAGFPITLEGSDKC